MSQEKEKIAATSARTPAGTVQPATTVPTSQVPLELLRKYSSPKPTVQTKTPPKKDDEDAGAGSDVK
jgi:hypothetical protein